MQKQNSDSEQRLEKALKAFVIARTTGGNAVLAMTELELASDGIALTALEKWERKFQAELSPDDEAPPAPPRWPWSKPKARPAQSEMLSLADVCSGDGFKREGTLRAFDGAAPNSFFMALIFRRLNDWVPKVREAARMQIPAIAVATPPAIIAEALFATLSTWHTWGRIETSGSQVVLDLLEIPALSGALSQTVLRNAKGPVSTVYAQLIKSPAFDQYLPEIASNAVQSFVRARAWRSLLESRVFWVTDVSWEWQDLRYLKRRKKLIFAERRLNVPMPFLELLRQSSEDRSPVVRRVAAELLIRELKNLGPEAESFAREFSKDSFPSVAERGVRVEAYR